MVGRLKLDAALLAAKVCLICALVTVVVLVWRRRVDGLTGRLVVVLIAATIIGLCASILSRRMTSRGSPSSPSSATIGYHAPTTSATCGNATITC